MKPRVTVADRRRRIQQEREQRAAARRAAASPQPRAAPIPAPVLEVIPGGQDPDAVIDEATAQLTHAIEWAWLTHQQWTAVVVAQGPANAIAEEPQRQVSYGDSAIANATRFRDEVLPTKRHSITAALSAARSARAIAEELAGWKRPDGAQGTILEPFVETAEEVADGGKKAGGGIAVAAFLAAIVYVAAKA